MKYLPRTQLLIYGFYVLVAIVITFPAITTLNTRLIGSETSDAYEMTRHIWWFRYALLNGQELFHQSHMGYPEGISGAPFRALPLQYAPNSLLALIIPIPAAYNIYVLLTLALNGWAMAWLAHSLLKTGSRIPAIIAGLVYMAFPVFQAHTAEGHAGLIAAWAICLYLYALFKLIDSEKLEWRWLILSVIFFLLSIGGHTLQSIYVLIPVTALFTLAQLVQQKWRAFGRVILMGMIGAGLFLLYMFPIISDTLSTDTYTGTTGFVRYSSDLSGVISPSFLHPVFDAVLDYPRATLGVNLVEGATYIGILAGILIIIGIIKYRDARWWLLLAGVAWLLSLGPILKLFDDPVQLNIDGYQTYIALPLAPFQELPGLNLARTPGRYNFTLALAAGMLAGYGAAWLWQRLVAGRKISNWHYALIALLMSGILFEYQTYFPMPAVSAEIPQAVYELQERRNVHAVFNIPWQHLLGAKEAMYLQSAHEKPMLAGQVSRVTPVNPAKLNILQDTLDPVLLREAGADVVIFHRQRATEIDLFDTLQNQLTAQGFGQPLYEDERIAIYETPVIMQPSESVFLVDERTNITSDTAFDFYSDSPQWIDISATFAAHRRNIQVWLDGTVIGNAYIEGETVLAFTVPIPQPDYHQLRVTLEPPCPVHHDETLACRSLSIRNLQFTESNTAVIRRDMAYQNGAYLISDNVQHTDDILTVRLWWRFDLNVPDTDIRFVHVLNEDGENVAQSDISAGNTLENNRWADLVTLPITDLPPGEYSVRVGWYNTLTNFTRYPVFETDLPGVQDAAPEIARFSIE